MGKTQGPTQPSVEVAELVRVFGDVLGESQRSNDRESHVEVIVGSHTGMGRLDATDTVHEDIAQGLLEIEYGDIGSREDRVINYLCLNFQPVQAVNPIGFDIAAPEDRKRLILGEIAKFFAGTPPTAPRFQRSLGNPALRRTTSISLVFGVSRPSLTLQDVGQDGVNLHSQSRKLVTSALTTALTSAPIMAAYFSIVFLDSIARSSRSVRTATFALRRLTELDN